MAEFGEQLTTTMKAGESLTSHQYLAVAFNDAKIANSGLEASGILQNKPANNEHATVVTFGHSKFKAGLAIAAGVRIGVTTSGYFIPCASGTFSIGMNGPNAVTSGSIGDGFFNFHTAGYQPTSNNV